MIIHRLQLGFAGILATTLLLANLSLANLSLASTIVRFDFSVGNVDVRLLDTATPNSVNNFLNYVTSGRYQDTFIHRVPQNGSSSSNFVVQGGGFKLNNSIFAATGITTDAPIGDEPGLTNLPETLAFAKNNLGATSQWFFNIGSNTFLDNQDFTVFGRVIRNTMGTVTAINNLDTVNASSTENGPGEDFDEIPVTNLQAVLDQNDITSSEAVMLNGVSLLNFNTADYNFDGLVDEADLAVWQAQAGASLYISDHVGSSPATFSEADGNGDGRVDGADLLLWQRNSGLTIPADFNLDGQVDGADLALFQTGYGTQTGALNADGDADLDGDVDGSDFLLWQRNFGPTPTLAALGAVPEPTSLALAALGLLTLLYRREPGRREVLPGEASPVEVSPAKWRQAEGSLGSATS